MATVREARIRFIGQDDLSPVMDKMRARSRRFSQELAQDAKTGSIPLSGGNGAVPVSFPQVNRSAFDQAVRDRQAGMISAMRRAADRSRVMDAAREALFGPSAKGEMFGPFLPDAKDKGYRPGFGAFMAEEAKRKLFGEDGGGSSGGSPGAVGGRAAADNYSSSFLNQLRSNFGRGSAFGMTAMALRGAGPIMGVTAAAELLKGLADGFSKMREMSNDTSKNGADMAMEFGKSVPILGRIFAAGESINEAFSGTQYALTIANKESDRWEKTIERTKEHAKDMKAVFEGVDKVLRDLRNKHELSGLDEPFKSQRIEEMSKQDAIRELKKQFTIDKDKALGVGNDFDDLVKKSNLTPGEGGYSYGEMLWGVKDGQEGSKTIERNRIIAEKTDATHTLAQRKAEVGRLQRKLDDAIDEVGKPLAFSAGDILGNLPGGVHVNRNLLDPPPNLSNLINPHISNEEQRRRELAAQGVRDTTAGAIRSAMSASGNAFGADKFERDLEHQRRQEQIQRDYEDQDKTGPGMLDRVRAERDARLKSEGGRYDVANLSSQIDEHRASITAGLPGFQNDNAATALIATFKERRDPDLKKLVDQMDVLLTQIAGGFNLKIPNN